MVQSIDSHEALPVTLSDAKAPLAEALTAYTELSRGVITFGELGDFSLTPEKPNTARIPGEIEVKLNGKPSSAGLWVIAFCRHDGTGDKSTFDADSIVVPPSLVFEEKPERVYPRSKAGIITELHLPLLQIGSRLTEQFGGSLELLGVQKQEKPNDKANPRIQRIGILGKSLYDSTLSTITVGYNHRGNRFGDPHSVFKRTVGVTICGFLAARDAAASSTILEALRPQTPQAA